MRYKDTLITYSGIALIIGCLSAAITDVIGILVVEDHNPIRQTISQLAHGDYAYIQDIGLTLFGLGVIAGAIGLYIWRSNFVSILWCSICLGLLGILTIVLSEFNQFAGVPGKTIHIVLAISIGILFLISTILIGIAVKDLKRQWYYVSISTGALFLLSCSGFLFISEAYEGAYERGVALVTFLWFCGLGYHLVTNFKKVSTNNK